MKLRDLLVTGGLVAIIAWGLLLDQYLTDNEFLGHGLVILGVFLLIIFLLRKSDSDRQSESFITDAILSSIHLGVITVDAKGYIKNINNRGKDILNLDDDHLVGQSFAVVVPWRKLDILLETLETGRGYNDYEALIDDGITLRINTARLVDYSRRTVGAVMVFQDITERRQWEEYMRQAEKLSIVGELAAGTAHEIRNPLTSIKGFVQLLRNRYHEQGLRDYTDIMLKEIDRINMIISEFLALSSHQPDPRIIDLETILKEIKLLVEAEALLKNIEVEIEVVGNLPFLVVDVEQIKQALINLTTNAFWAMEDGGRLTIKAKYIGDEKMVQLTVTDTGVGMSSEIMPHIFKPFYSTRENATGFGLTVAFRIIQNHGGILSATSQPGEGTVFTVKLPVGVTSQEGVGPGNRVGWRV